jgi:hypothetical protein
VNLEHLCGHVHAACNLVNYIFNRVAVTYNPAFVNMTADKNDLGHDGRITGDFAHLIDSIELETGKGSDRGEPYSVSCKELFKSKRQRKPSVPRMNLVMK